MLPATFILFCLMSSPRIEELAVPQLCEVKTWEDLSRAPQVALTGELSVRLGISTRKCAIYGNAVIYCLADGLKTVERKYDQQIGPLRLEVRRDYFSERFWGILYPPSIPVVGRHKCYDGLNLFAFPITVTCPADAKSQSQYSFIEKAFSLKYDPAKSPELSVGVFSHDMRSGTAKVGSTIGKCAIEVTDANLLNWVPLKKSDDNEHKSGAWSPVWDPLLPMAAPKNLTQPLPTLFPENASGDLVLKYSRGKLVLSSSSTLSDHPNEALLWRCGADESTHLPTSRPLVVANVLKTSANEYEIHISTGQKEPLREKIHVQFLYSELGWAAVDPNRPAIVNCSRKDPRLPILSNRLDFFFDNEPPNQSKDTKKIP